MGNLLTLDTQFAEALWPMVMQMSRTEQCSDDQWLAIEKQSSLGPVLQNARVDEEDGRSLSLMEWRSIWEAAAGICRTPVVAGRRQEYALTNAWFAVQHADVIHELLLNLNTRVADAALHIASTAYENLPQGAACAEEIHLVAGTASGGFTDETGVYVDVAVLAALGANPDLTEQFLSHELWHSGHWSLIERHHHVNEPWFMPLAQLQSEGLVNCLIGGTYELYAYKAKTGQEDEKERAFRFLAYADSMETEASQRIGELYSAIARLLEGDQTTYLEFSQALPDAPGYLHGRHMARVIDKALGRESLLATCPDPVRFLTTYSEACERLGLKPPSEEVCAMLARIS